MAGRISSLWPATALKSSALIVAVALATQSTVTTQELRPVKVHIFAAPSAAAEVGASVADFQKVVTEKLAKSMRLVPNRSEADLTVELLDRNSRLMSRELHVQVHHRGGQRTLTRFYQGTVGGFDYLAKETMNLLDAWCQTYYEAVVGLAPADPLRHMPPDFFFDMQELRSSSVMTRANAAVRLGTRRQAARATAPGLVELLGDNTPVTNLHVGAPAHLQNRKNTFPVGVIAGRALASIGAIDDLYVALSSDKRERARENAALALGVIPGDRTVTALQAAMTTDPSARVRKAAARSIEELEKTSRRP